MPSITHRARAIAIVGLALAATLATSASTLAGGAAGPWPW